MENFRRQFSRCYSKIFGLPFIGMYLRTRMFWRNLPKKEFSAILDAGCGDGTYSFGLAKKFPKAKITGIDISEKSVEFCRREKAKKHFKNADFFSSGLLEFSSDEKFDLAVFSEVLQYMPEKRKAIGKISSFLKKGGLAIVFFPAKNWFDGLVLKKSIKKSEIERFNGFTQNGLLSENEAMLLFRAAGLRTKKFCRFMGFFGTLAWELEFLAIHSRLQRFYYLFFPFIKFIAFFDVFFKNPKGRNILIVAEKNE